MNENEKDRCVAPIGGCMSEQWRSVMQQLVHHIEDNTCTHEDTHRGGAIWEICNDCGAKWADDEGGRPEFSWPPVVEAARKLIALSNPADGGEQAVAAEPVAWMAVSDDDERHLGFDKQDLYREVLRVYTMHPLYTAPLNADLLVRAAYMAAAEACESCKRPQVIHYHDSAINDCLDSIRALTPDSARKELERVCMDVAIAVAEESRGGIKADDYTKLLLSQIVHQVLSNKLDKSGIEGGEG